MSLLHHYKASTNPGGNVDLISDQAGSLDLTHAGGAGAGWWRDYPDTMLWGSASSWSVQPSGTLTDFTALTDWSLSFALKEDNNLVFQYRFHDTNSPFAGWGIRCTNSSTVEIWDQSSWQTVGTVVDNAGYNSCIVNWTYGGDVTVYWNGVSIGTVSGTNAFGNPDALAIWGSNYAYNDNIQVHDRHLTTQEIADHAANPRGWVESPPVPLAHGQTTPLAADSSVTANGTWEDVPGMSIDILTETGKKYLVQGMLGLEGGPDASWPNAKLQVGSVRMTGNGWTSVSLEVMDRFTSEDNGLQGTVAYLLEGDGYTHTFKAEAWCKAAWSCNVKALSTITWMELPDSAIVLQNDTGLIYNTRSSNAGEITMREWDTPNNEYILFASHTPQAETDSSPYQSWWFRAWDGTTEATEVLFWSRAYTNIGKYPCTGWAKVDGATYPKLRHRYVASSTGEGRRCSDVIAIVFPAEAFASFDYVYYGDTTDAGSSSYTIPFVTAAAASTDYLLSANICSETVTGDFNYRWNSGDNALNLSPQGRSSGNWMGWCVSNLSRVLTTADADIDGLVYDRVRVSGTNTRIAYYGQTARVELKQNPGPAGLGDEAAWWCPSLNDSPLDISGNGNNGVYDGGMTTAADTDEGGERAYEFDGVNDFIDCPTNIVGETEKLTACGWIKPTGTAQQALIGQFNSSANRRQWLLYVNANVPNALVNDDGTLSGNTSISGGVATSGEWVHIAMTHDPVSGDLELFVDGVSVATGNAVGRDQNSEQIQIGAHTDGTGSWVDGLADDIRMYDRILTSNEIAHLATDRGVQGILELPTGLGDEAVWYCPSLNDSPIDISGNENNGGYLNSTGTIEELGEGGTRAYDFGSASGTLTPGITELNNIDQGGDWSVSYWYKLTETYDSSGNHYIVDCRGGNNSTTNAGFAVIHRGTGLTIALKRGADSSITSNGALGTGLSSTDLEAWNHFAVSYSNTTGDVTSYVNGVLVDTESLGIAGSSLPASPISTLTVGNYALSPAGIYAADGSIDDVRIHSRALTGAEITHLASERGVEGPPPVGLGDELSWASPSLYGQSALEQTPANTDYPTFPDLSGNSLPGIYAASNVNAGWSASAGWVSDTDEGGLWSAGFGQYLNNNFQQRISFDDSSLGFDAGGRTYTLWYRDTAANVTAGRQLISFTPGTDPYPSLRFPYSNNNTWLIYLNSANYKYGPIGDTTRVADGNWHHVAIHIAGNGIDDIDDATLWVDGVPVIYPGDGITASKSSSPSASAGCSVGGQSNEWSSTTTWDDFRVYEGKLSDKEVNHLASARAVEGLPPVGLGDEVAWYCPSLNASGLDSSGNAIGRTLGVGTDITPDVTAGGIAAFSGGAVTVDDDALLNNLGPVTFSGWFNPSYQITSDFPLVDTGIITWDIDESSTNYRLRFNVDGSGGDVNAFTSYDTDGDVYSGEWMHLAVTWDGTFAAGSATIYRNGAIVSTTSTGSGTAKSDTGTTVLGSSLHDGYDDIRIFDRVLTGTEIHHLASARGVQGVLELPTGLGGEIAWYCPSLNDSSIDISGSGNNGDYLGGMGTIADTEEGGTRAYDFDGVDDEVFIDPSPGTGDFTAISYCAWVKASDGGNWKGVIARDNFAHSTMLIKKSSDSSSYFRLMHNNGTLGQSNLSGSATVFDDTWHHVVAMWDGTTQSIYVDGVLDTSKSLVGGVVGDNLATGTLLGNYSGNRILGELDDVRIFDRALTAAEITYLATKRGILGPAPVGLGDEIAWYCPSIEDSARDLSGNVRDGTYNGGMATVADTGEGGSRAYDFDGVDDWIEAGTLSNGGSISGACWFKSTQTSENVVLFGCWGTASGSIQTFRIDRNALFSDYMRVYTRDVNNATSESNSTSPAWQSDEWVHVAFSYESGGDLILYQDGVEINSVSASDDIRDQQGMNIHIGSSSDGGTSFAEGLMDDIRIINRVITPAEVFHLASKRGNLGPAPVGLGDEIAWYCPTISGNANDLTGNGNSGTYQGGIEVIHESDGTAHYLSTNGSSDSITGSISGASGLPMTITGWYTIPASSNSPIQFSVGSGSAVYIMIGGEADRFGSLTPLARIRNSASTGTALGTSGFSADTWVHVAAVVTSNSIDMYENGVLKSSTSHSLDISTPSEFEILGNEDGKADDLRVYDRVLTEAEITQLATYRGIQGAAPSAWQNPFRNSFFYNPFFRNEALK